ncbi:MAG: hypothetical protein V9F82_07660 [Dermatophilaceae bacterium]
MRDTASVSLPVPAFTGVIGSAERCQYAAVGARVNLGARLMMKADWGEVMADENVQRNRNFKFTYRGEGYYKGFEQSHSDLSAQRAATSAGRASFSGDYFGRADRIAKRCWILPRPCAKTGLPAWLMFLEKPVSVKAA